MKKIKIISDSTCDLSQDLINKHDIEIIPLYVNFGEETYLDGVNLTVPQMYDLVLKEYSTKNSSSLTRCFRRSV